MFRANVLWFRDAMNNMATCYSDMGFKDLVIKWVLQIEEEK